MGAMFMIMPVFFIVGSIAAQIFKKWLDRRIIMITGSLLAFVAALLIGPSTFLNFNQDKLGIVITGLVIMGISAGSIFP